jgi:hypothetical protein
MPVDDIPVLADKDDLARVRHRKEHDGSGMPHDVERHLAPVGQPDTIAVHVEDLAVEDAFALKDL